METKETLIKRFYCFIFESDKLISYLEDMALKGWRLKSIGACWILKFERTEPQKLHYSVDIAGKKYNKEKDNSKVDLYTEFSWNYVCSNGLFTVYVSDRENAALLFPENEDRKKNIKALSYLSGVYLLFLLTTAAVIFAIRNDYTDIVSNTYFILLPAIAAAFFCNSVIQTVYYLLWRKKVKRHQNSTSKTYQKIKNIISLLPGFIFSAALVFCITDGLINKDYINLRFYSLFLFLAFLLIFLVLVILKSIIKREIKITAIIVLIVTGLLTVYLNMTLEYYDIKDEYSDIGIVIEEAYYAKLYRDKLPLTMNDLNYPESKHRSSIATHHRNALASFDSYQDMTIEHLWEKAKTVQYEVFTSKYDVLIDGFINRELLKENKFTRTDDSVWGAKAVYEEKRYPYRKAAVYEDKVIIIYYCEQIDKQTVEIIKDKLLKGQ